MDSEVRVLNLRTGITVPCLRQGGPTAKPLLLLHAWGKLRRSFGRLIPLPANYRVVAPDRANGRGLGEQSLLWFQLGRSALAGLYQATPPLDPGVISAPTNRVRGLAPLASRGSGGAGRGRGPPEHLRQ